MTKTKIKKAFPEKPSTTDFWCSVCLTVEPHILREKVLTCKKCANSVKLDGRLIELEKGQDWKGL